MGTFCGILYCFKPQENILVIMEVNGIGLRRHQMCPKEA